ncbi:MAG: glycoside hydrolase family 43 protein [Bacteroidota bacterium]
MQLKTGYLLICFAILLTSPGHSCSNRQLNDDNDPDIIRVPLGDPFIMLWNGTYYAYGTQSPDGIAMYESDDLENWFRPDQARDGLVLHKDDVWADRWFWAPEVYYINDRFYMYYSADEHICVATSNSPYGPFRQEVRKPMIDGEKTIDNSLFIDEDGKPYLYFNRFNDGLNIWVAELEDNLMDIKPGSMVKCIHVSQAWEEVWPRVNEGAFVIKHKNCYFLTYSANSYESPFYGVGFATASSAKGPWIKYENNPILQKPGILAGVGHSAMFTGKDGQLRIVFHAHNSKSRIHPRNMYISKVSFESKEGKEVMVIDKNYITAALKAR